MSRVISRRGPAAQPTTAAGIFGKVKQHLIFKTESETLKKRAEKMRDEILDFLEKNGEVDEKGSLSLDLPAHILAGGKDYASIKRQRKVSTSFDEGAAETLLHTKGLLARVQKTTVTITSSMPAEADFLCRDDEVIDVADADGFLYEDARIEWSTFLDQNEVYVLNQEGLITDEELDLLFVETISWAYMPLQS